MVNVAVLGYGTVGSGVVEVLNGNREKICKKAGTEIHIKYVLDLLDFPGDPIQEKIVHDFDTILQDPEVEIIAEVMGGINPAYKFVKAALEAGKSVCTSNKELVAKYGPELLEIAKSKNRNFLFEASVGGGIPIIRPLNASLTADEISEITGILNGTTNYILTKMDRDGLPFEQVLKEAQDLGYAERNPEADVEGYDACRKIAILASLAFGKHVNFEEIYTEGITKITDVDFQYAKQLKTSIKIFGKAKKADDKFYALVSPVMIDSSHPLYAVNDVYNGILVEGNMVGKIMFYGSGAGKLPTASAVVADIVDAAKHLNTNIIQQWSREPLGLMDIKDSTKRFFVRVEGDAEQKWTEVEKAFGKAKLVQVEGLENEFGFVTPELTERAYDNAAKEITGIITRIRMEG